MWNSGLTATAVMLGLAVSVQGLVAQDKREWSVLSGPSVVIGGESGEAAYLFQHINAARFLPDGGLAVADAGQQLVRVFDRDGRFQLELGGRGEGPGEFLSIDGMWLTPMGDIAVWDAHSSRVSIFGPTGEVKRTGNLAGRGGVEDLGSPEVYLGTFSNGDVGLASLHLDGPGRGQAGTFERWTLGRFSENGEFLGRLGEIDGMLRVGGTPGPFSPVPYVAIHGTSAFITQGYAADVLEVAESGRRIRVISVPPVTVSVPGVWQRLEGELEKRNGTLFLRLLRQGRIPREATFPQVGGLLVDDEGNLWMKIYEPLVDSVWLRKTANEPAPGGQWRVIRSSGQVAAVVQMPHNLIPLAIQGQRLLGVALDSLDVERVVVHQLRR